MRNRRGGSGSGAQQHGVVAYLLQKRAQCEKSDSLGVCVRGRRTRPCPPERVWKMVDSPAHSDVQEYPPRQVPGRRAAVALAGGGGAPAGEQSRRRVLELVRDRGRRRVGHVDGDGELEAVDAWDVIRQPEAAPAGKLVVADFRGDWAGLGAARLLAAAGHEVTLAVRGYAAGESLQQYVRDRLLAAISRQRIIVLPLVRPYGVDDDTVYLQHVLTEEPVLVEGVAGLVLARGSTPPLSSSTCSGRRVCPPSASATAWRQGQWGRRCSRVSSPRPTSDRRLAPRDLHNGCTAISRGTATVDGRWPTAMGGPSRRRGSKPLRSNP